MVIAFSQTRFVDYKLLKDLRAITAKLPFVRM